MLKIIKTSDGSDTIYNSDLNETYHSVHGSVSESKHVYIQNGLDYLLKGNKKNHINILEIGFGTGLNLLLTHTYLLNKKKSCFYHTLEPYPLPNEIISELNYVEKVDIRSRKLFEFSHSCPQESEVELEKNILLLKSSQTLEKIALSREYDIIYFDAFAPSKQPEIWGVSNLKKLYDCLVEGGALVTYCSSGQFKRDIKEVGYTLEVLNGPKGKKEMVRAIK